MGDFSFVLIFCFGLLFGFIFQDLLKEAGLKQGYDSWLVPVGLAFLSFAGFMLFQPIMFGSFRFPDMGLFYNSIPFWLTVSLLIGGFARIGLQKFKKGSE